jgi:hypothetical protein
MYSKVVRKIRSTFAKSPASKAGNGNNAQALRDLIAANRIEPDPGREIRIRDLRLTATPDTARAAEPIPGVAAPVRYEQSMPTCSPAELSAPVVRAAFAERGCLYVPGVLGPEEVEELRSTIEQAHLAWGDKPRDPCWGSSPNMPTRADAVKLAGARSVAHGSGGFLAVDSPRALFKCCDMLERHGLVDLARNIVGEAPVYSASKFVLWRVPSVGPETGWHQDGRFLGDKHDIRSLNVWTALTDCGQGEDAPGMELVLENLDYYVGSTEDSHFDWSVSNKQVDDFRKRVPVVVPRFKSGDMLLFDHWLLHRSWRIPGMTTQRYAIESWFFAPSAFPGGRMPMTA